MKKQIGRAVAVVGGVGLAGVVFKSARLRHKYDRFVEELENLMPTIYDGNRLGYFYTLRRHGKELGKIDLRNLFQEKNGGLVLNEESAGAQEFKTLTKFTLSQERVLHVYPLRQPDEEKIDHDRSGLVI